MCAFFLTIQIFLTLFKVLLSDSLLGLVKSGAEQIASCQNQPTNHWWWANVSALSAHGECYCFLNPSITFKWKMVQSGLQTDLNSVLDLAHRAWLRIRVDHNFHTCCLYTLGLKSWEYSWPSDHSWSRLLGAVHDDLGAEFRSVYLCLLEWLQTFFVKDCRMWTFKESCRTKHEMHTFMGNDWVSFFFMPSAAVNILWINCVFLHFLFQM